MRLHQPQGGKAVPLNDGIRITGVESLSGGTVDSYGDHRIVMAIAIASTVARAIL